ncbi:MAG: hypothetical protein R6T96_13045 [Longimicrobiales bacterium]
MGKGVPVGTCGRRDNPRIVDPAHHRSTSVHPDERFQGVDRVSDRVG